MKVSKGSIFKRKNSPYLYLNISVNGKRYVRKTKYLHSEIDLVKKEVLPYLRQKILNGEIVVEDKEEQKVKTFSYYSDLFLNSKKFLKYNTLRRYEITVNRFNIHYGSIPINEIKSSDIKNYLFSQNIKSLTFRNYLSIFRDIFNESVLDNTISSNPCDKIKVPKNNDSKEIVPFTIDEVNLILDNADTWFKNFLATAFYTGMRIGELFALKWSNVDLKAKQIKVSESRFDNHEGTTKTGNIRYVPIFDSLIPYLKNQKKITGLKKNVFLSDNGKYLRHTNLRIYKWIPLLDKIKLKRRVLYNTRHTFATNMLQSNEFTLNQIAYWLGHSDIRMLVSAYNNYIHSDLLKFSNTQIDVFCNKNCNKDKGIA